VLLDIAAKDFKKAETQLAHLHDVDPTRAAGGSAVLLAAKGQLDKAAEVLARARMQPESGSLMHSMLGALAEQSHRFDVAVAEYKLALVDRPDDIALLMSLGNAASQKGQWDAAIAAFERAQKISPNEFTPTVMLAFTLQRAGKSDRAMEEYRRALGLQPDNPRVLNNLAFLIVETHGNLDEAKKLAEDAVRKDPKDPQFKDTLGWIYFQKDDAKFALPIFKALVEQHPTDTTFLYHLGAAQLRTGTKDAGRQTLQAALSNGASGSEAEKIRALLSSN
jgi:Flp pilus assembly protein TadD